MEEELREQRPERRLYRFIEERAGANDYRQHLGLVSLVRRDFRELSRLFTEKEDGETAWNSQFGPAEKSVDRIVLYVDDLDRCQPQRVVEVLEAVHLLLDFPLFVAVVAVDPRWVKQSLRSHYSKLLNGMEKRRNEENLSRVERGRHDEKQEATPLDYLEKIFHIPFHLPSMKEEGFQKLIRKLVGESESTESILGAKGISEEATPGIATERTSQAARQTYPASPSALEAQHPPGESGVTSGVSEPEDANYNPGQSGGSVIGILRLADWEVERMYDYASLIRTPRAAKRFVNTYRLVRAGLLEEEWNLFQGDENVSGEFSIAMLLLAAAAGSPALARDWFDLLRVADSTALAFPDDSEDDEHSEWREFKRVYDAMFARTTLNFNKNLFGKWLDRVERFAF